MKRIFSYTSFHVILFLFVFLVVSGARVFSQSYQVRIATVGNSITYGAELDSPATECYPAQLQQLLAAVYGDTCLVQNFSVSARTMMRSSELPLWNEPEFMNALEYVPDICLILLGTNDSKPYRWEAWGDEFLSDYLAMIDTFKFRNPNTRFIVGDPPPIWPGHPYGSTFSERHNDSILVNYIIPLIDTVAERTGAMRIDFHTPFVDSIDLFPDQLHPDVVASHYMAEMVFDSIISSDMIHQVDAGWAYVSRFKQSSSPVAVGDSVTLVWTTLFADSVLLDGNRVELSGSMKVLAEADRVYTLTAIGPNNTSEFPLYLQTYLPVPSGLVITYASGAYRNGEPDTLFVHYKDQAGRQMAENPQDVTWTVIEGEGMLEEPTDTSVIFIPVAAGGNTVSAEEGELYDEIYLYVVSMPSAIPHSDRNNAVVIYPNPVSEKLYFRVQVPETSTMRIKLFTILGEKVLDENSISGNEGSIVEINVSGLDEGVYFYTVYLKNETISGQFIKRSNSK